MSSLAVTSFFNFVPIKMMDATPHPSLKLLVLFLGFSHAFSSAASALPATRSIKEDAMEIEPFKESDPLVGTEFVEEEEGRMELEMKNDYPEPGPNPHHYPPPNPSKPTP